ncbi:phage holin family protein [Bifidobacterium aquikefiricola]|uniref:Phage holin family protein n=1 Tax=Bifidobacterium aquikefiricola TaxID=3059038 RepID=A0AB39U958_9BIFI
MGHFIGRWFALTVAAGVMAWLLPGIVIIGSSKVLALLSFALFMALINASIKPIVHVLALPITILTLGLAALVINVIFMELASWLSLAIFQTGVYIEGFWWAVFGGFIMMIVNGIVGAIIHD